MYYHGLFKLVALIFDEYDAMRPDVAFLMTKVLEAEGGNITEKNKVIKPNEYFRLFATANTIGLVTLLDFIQVHNKLTRLKWKEYSYNFKLSFPDKEMEIILSKNKILNNPKGKETVANRLKLLH